MQYATPALSLHSLLHNVYSLAQTVSQWKRHHHGFRVPCHIQVHVTHRKQQHNEMPLDFMNSYRRSATISPNWDVQGPSGHCEPKPKHVCKLQRWMFLLFPLRNCYVVTPPPPSATWGNVIIRSPSITPSHHSTIDTPPPRSHAQMTQDSCPDGRRVSFEDTADHSEAASGTHKHCCLQWCMLEQRCMPLPTSTGSQVELHSYGVHNVHVTMTAR